MAPRVLVVEDDPEFLHLLQVTLEQAGYLVYLASSGPSALRWLADPAARPDLVLLDLGLPGEGMDGLTLCRALKKDAATRRIPVVVLTASASNEKRLEATVAQADLVLHKPIAAATLLAAAARLLTSPRPERRGVLHRGGLELDADARTVFYNGARLEDLGPRLFDMLYLLVERHPAPVAPRAALAALKLKCRDDQVSVIVSRLRARLNRAFGCGLVATVPSRGYRLELPVSAPAPR